MLKFLEKVFGSKREKDVESLLPIVDEINEIYSGLASLTDDELKGKTAEFRGRIHAATDEITGEIGELRERLKEDVPHEERVEISERLGVLGKELDEVTKQVLDELLPEAFAVVKETCRRLVGQTFTVAGQQLKWDMI